MLHRKTHLVVFMVLLATNFSLGQNSISAAQARDHVGEKAVVCGHVASTHFAAKSRGMPTFINVDKPYPDQIFTILIWGTDRSKFDDPEDVYRNKRICVTGLITLYRGTPEIIARDSGQIKLE
jgi:hypothetical protein